MKNIFCDKSLKRSNPLNVPAILYISARSDIGGGPKHLYDLTSTLNKLNPDWKIIIAAPVDDPYGSKFQHLAYIFFQIPSRKWSFIAFLKLLCKCRKEKVRFVHSHGRGAGFYSRLLKLFGFCVVHTFHGIHLEPNLSTKVKLFLERLLRPLTDLFICVSDDERKEALNLNLCRKDNSFTIYNGIDVRKFHNQVISAKKKGGNCSPFKIPSDSFVLGTLARFHYQKGLDLLIRSFKNLVKFYPDKNFLLLIAGFGKEREKLFLLLQKENLQKKIQILEGILEVSPFLSAIDCYVSSARWEGMPVSLIEAMSAELPCIVSNVIGHRELIRHGQNGFLFELDDPDGFLEAITALEQNPSLRKEIGVNAYEHVLKNHTLEEMVLKTAEIYKKI